MWEEVSRREVSSREVRVVGVREVVSQSRGWEEIFPVTEGAWLLLLVLLVCGVVCLEEDLLEPGFLLLPLLPRFTKEFEQELEPPANAA